MSHGTIVVRSAVSARRAMADGRAWPLQAFALRGARPRSPANASHAPLARHRARPREVVVIVTQPRIGGPPKALPIAHERAVTSGTASMSMRASSLPSR